jgi:hypothetical protein
MTNQNRLWRILPVCLVLILLVPTVPVSGSSGGPDASRLARAPIVASLDPVQGLVQHRIKDAPENEWQTATERRLIQEGDWIRTDALGMAYLTFFEGIESEILPNSVVQVTKLSLDEPTNTFDISLDMLVGDTLSRIDQTMDAETRYEIHTPSAVIVVRGTEFWSSASWLRQTTVNNLGGIVTVTGVTPEGLLGETIIVGEDMGLKVYPAGQLGDVGPLVDVPEYPPAAPLAPATCGNLVCEPGEEAVCSLDCMQLAQCGDGICDLPAGEGAVTCPADCVPSGAPPVAPPPTTDTTTTQPQPSQPCTISTRSETVPLRVGPGENRGVRDFLTANRSFDVIGWVTTSDGQKWWELDMVGVPEAWVSERDVDESGDCSEENVPNSEAPPLVIPPPEPAPGPSDDFPDLSIYFVADRYAITYEQCVTIRWDVDGAKEVYYQGQGVVGHASSIECPMSTTTYTLHVLTVEGTSIYRTITITVGPYVY